MEYGCADTSTASIGNVFFEVLQTERNVILVWFYDNKSKECIVVWSSVAAIGLPNGTIIYKLNETLIPHGIYTYTLSTSKNFGFGVAVRDHDKHHGGKQYIHYGYWVIPMKSGKHVMFVTIWELTQWNLHNLACIILTLDHTWE